MARQPAYRPTPHTEKPLFVWEDATSYSRDDPYPRVPRSFSMRLTRDVRIVVISEHIYHKGQWIVTCEPWFVHHEIGMSVASDNADEAKALALKIVGKKIAELTAAMSAIQ